METTITYIKHGNFFCVRCIFVLLAALLNIIVHGQSLYGPETNPPKGASIAYTGTLNDGGIGRSGGKTVMITNVILANTTTVYWTILEDSVKLSLDGDTYETGEILSMSVAGSDLSNGIVAWTGNTQIPISNIEGTGIDHYDALFSKFIATVTDQDDVPLTLVSPAVSGLSAGTGGAVLIQANTDIVKVRLEMFVSIDSTTWAPHLDYYDAEDTPPGIESAYSVVDFGFYWANDPPVLSLNIGANVDESDTVRITSVMLEATDVESTVGEIFIVFDLVGDQNLPVHGKLTINETEISSGDSISMFELVNDNLSYIHDGSESSGDSIAFSVIDGDGAKCYVGGDSVFFFMINITPVDDPPTVLVNAGGNVTEDSVLVISDSHLLGSDPESSIGNLTFTLDPEANSDYPQNGLLKLNGVPLSDGSAFTQLDINNSLLTYDHDGSETTTDGFVFNFSDEYGHLAKNNGSNLFYFSITISTTNDDPVLTKLQTLNINEGETGLISSLYLAASDEESAADEILFIYDPEMNYPGPHYGTVLLDGVEVEDGASFSMQDITDNLVSYVHDGGEGRSDFFIFRIIDDEGGVAHDGEYTDFHFNISIANINDDPFVETPVPDQTVLTGQELNYTFPEITFGDPDESDELTYSAIVLGEPGLPAWLSFDGATRTFSGTPLEADKGTYSVVLTAQDLDLAECKDTFEITVKGPVNVEPIEEPLCRIYPNPASGILHIYLENIDLMLLEIRVLDAMGKLVYYQNNVESEQVMLDLTGQPPGLYFVKINNADTDLSFRVFIK